MKSFKLSNGSCIPASLCSILVALLLSLTGVKPLHAAPIDDYFTAIKNDNDGAVVTLLFRGLDVNTVDAQGRHGLQIALAEGSLKVAKTLLDLTSTQVNTKSQQDETPLMMAAIKGHLEMAKRIIKKGGDVNKTGWTPLHYAATGGHIDMMKLLLAEHAYIDAESPNKSTPIMLAAMYGTPEAVELLIVEGADLLLKNELGLTALDFAKQADRNDIAKVIEDAIRWDEKEAAKEAAKADAKKMTVLNPSNTLDERNKISAPIDVDAASPPRYQLRLTNQLNMVKPSSQKLPLQGTAKEPEVQTNIRSEFDSPTK
ncbi:MAG TPA: ankyrin repeat domain-containing protein [Burkholderiaceae bacterium]|nr:ankyrin repeat domain-containing protein [Burkholderiaceae bacterium]